MRYKNDSMLKISIAGFNNFNNKIENMIIKVVLTLGICDFFARFAYITIFIAYIREFIYVFTIDDPLTKFVEILPKFLYPFDGKEMSI